MTAYQEDILRLPTVRSDETCTPPEWALLQRSLLDEMQRACLEFVDRYTLPDGTLRWRTAWPGMDGSDDPYEAFYGFPLLYLLGGDETLLHIARRQWEAVTWQWTAYGQIYQEFDAYYDWMHHGESSTLFYLLGLADPTSLKERQRAVRFAHFYTGDDPTAPNYDQARKLMRSPLTGSRGPRFTTTAEDWLTHRPVLDNYPPPFEDIPGVHGPTCPWSDDTVFAQILERINTRMTRGDVPLNLTATSLLTHAYLLTGEERYRQWVLEYQAAWEERTARNGGIIPDNVGPDDVIGQYMDGKWWGGYYGWRWPHGAHHILEPIAIAGCNAVVLDGQTTQLKLIRSQLDRLWELGTERDGVWVVPHKHVDSGWTHYQPLSPIIPVYCWSVSQEEQDRQRVLRLSEQDHWMQPITRIVKGNGAANNAQWFEYIQGRNPSYPIQILRTNYEQMHQRLVDIRTDESDPESWDVHHWQDKSPILAEGLVQLMLGAPLNLYHGGLLLTPVRYYDGKRRRPGLPQQVGALVEHVSAQTATLHLVNMNAQEEHDIIVQAGSLGEHTFQTATILSHEGREGTPIPVEGKWLRVHLGPGANVRVRVQMSRLVNRPSYETPWLSQEDYPVLLQGRVL